MELPIIEPAFLQYSLPTITTEDGDLIDLAYRDMIVDLDTTTIMSSPILVTAEFAGRPDLLALAILGDQSKFDIICEYNSISDPFSISAGDVLYIPTTDTIGLNARIIAHGLQVATTPPTTKDNIPTTNKSMQELNSKIAQVDPARATKATVPGVSTPPVRTPNMTVTPPTAIVSKGEIELGTNPNSVTCATSMTDAQSLTYSIREAVLRKIQAS